MTEMYRLGRHSGANSYAPFDYLTTEGTARLITKIEQYWKSRGHDVVMHVVKDYRLHIYKTAFCSIRSDMIDGLPRTMKARKLDA